MTEHKKQNITANHLRNQLESRFARLHFNDQYNGKHAPQYDFLEQVLADVIHESEGSESCVTEDTAPSTCSVLNGAGKRAPVGVGGTSRPAGRSFCPPKLLTGGIPSTDSPNSPTLPLEDVPEFSHGGYDGGIEVGFDGTWNPLKFPKLLEVLEEAKNRATEIQKGPEGVVIEVVGEEILVMPTGAKVGGMLYKFRFMCRGVEFMIHSNPPKERQPVRVKYHAESLIGNHFFTVHEQFVMPFLKRLGLVVHADKPSRIDMQVMIDVSVDEVSRLIRNNHLVTKLRKRKFIETDKHVETVYVGLNSDVSLVFYDKSKEMRSKRKNIVKDTFFVERCIGDEWINSGRPITRVELRLSRKALKCLGVNTIADLKERERAIVDLVTTDWIRLLKEPKVRGHENSAEVHPLWERIRNLFMNYFSGAEVGNVVWEKKQNVTCDASALEKQALGCLSKALACRFGEQVDVTESVHLAEGWVDRMRIELHTKLNVFAEHVRISSGIELGVTTYDSAGYDSELDDVRACFSPAVLAARDERLKEWFAEAEAKR